MIALRDAATVMLVRDAPEGMEVFLLRRSLQSDFVGGAYVFPGGAVDETDRHSDLEGICRGLSDDGASQRLGLREGGLAFWIAAVRECFEEAGVLLAVPAGGVDVPPVSFADEAVAHRFRAHRKAVDAGELRLVDLCRMEGLELAVDRIHYFSHWITPEGPPRRYDTRFFVAAAPAEQVPLHDDHETIASLWLRPSEALARHQAGEIELILPTIKNLEAIAGFDGSDALLAAAASAPKVPTVEPVIVRHRGGRARILLPGQPGYDEARAGG